MTEKFNGLCLNCFTQIENKTTRARYCTDKCKSAAKYKRTFYDKVCEICLEEFSAKENSIRFCSRECQDVNYSKLMKKDDVLLVCQYCNIEFKVPYVDRNTRKVCSYSCSTKLTNTKIDRNIIAEKISKSHIKGHKEGKLKAYLKGKHLTDEVKNKIRQTREKNGSNNSENNPMFGKKHSKETKEKISKTRSENILNGNYNKWFKKGEYFSSKLNRNIIYRSSWEKNYYRYLDADSTVITYINEPFYISYLYDRKRKYIPDILITYIDGKQKLIEIKPSCHINAEINLAKFKAAREYCSEKNMIFEVWTELDNPYLDKEIIE